MTKKTSRPETLADVLDDLSQALDDASSTAAEASVYADQLGQAADPEGEILQTAQGLLTAAGVFAVRLEALRDKLLGARNASEAPVKPTKQATPATKQPFRIQHERDYSEEG